MNSTADTTIARSGFVTGLAWVFITLAGFSTLISVLQNVMITFMFPAEEFQAAMRESQGDHSMPGVFRLMFENFRLFFAAFLLLSVCTLVAAIGLLKRKNWARLVFIGIMGVGIVWNLVSLSMILAMSSMIPDMPAQAESGAHGNFELARNVMIGFNVVMVLAFSGLFAWIIKRLVSTEISREFSAG